MAEFRIRDRSMLAAQRAIEAALAAGEPDAPAARMYLAAVERYFGDFTREARGRLEELDARISRLNQVQFNLQAERGVALRRIEKTQGVLSAVAELG